MMQWTAPGFVHLLYKLLNAQNNLDEKGYVAVHSRDVPIAATDGKNVIINPDTYYKLALPQRVYVLGHEIVHNMFGDVELLHACHESGTVTMPDGRKIPFDEEEMQLAMDARINALLDESHIGSRPDIGWFDKEVKAADSVYPIYERYVKAKAKKPPGDQPGNRPGNKPGTSPQPNGNPGGGFDKLLKPGAATGQAPQDAVSERDPQQWAVEIQTAKTLESLRQQGDLPAGLEKLFKQLLEPEISWLDHIETLVMRQVGDGSIDWTQPHPYWGAYDFYVPNESGTGAGWIVVWGDTSGSVFSDGVQARNIAELAGLMEQVNPARLTLIWCDAGIQKGSVIELQDPSELRDAKPVGGGGTSYKPVLDWIAKNNRGESPDLFLAFTDGYVTFAKEHPFPTIWCSSTKKGEVKYPFGQVVYINDLKKGA